MSIIAEIAAVARPLARLYSKGRRLAVGIDVASIGEVQFFRDVLLRLVATQPEMLIYLFHRGTDDGALAQQLPELRSSVMYVPYPWRTLDFFAKLDLYITTEQFVSGPPSVYTVTLFHGQPSKGVTFKLFDSDTLAANDAMFLYGPLHKQALWEFLEFSKMSIPSHLTLFEIGYTKSDRLVNGEYSREKVLLELGLDPSKKTIIYAPAFNKGASMQECAKDILAELCSLGQYNIIAKLAIDCLIPEKVGGVDWYYEVSILENRFPNFRLIRSLEADPGLAASDVLITCVSSVSFEFLALKKPVIFVDTPKFFRETLQNFFPNRDVSSWVDRTAVNGGREFGLLVSRPDELPAAIEEVLAHPEDYPKRQDELPECLLYNPGRATEAAVSQIEVLLAGKVRSRRPANHRSIFDRVRGRVKRRFRELKASQSPWYSRS